MPRRKYYFDMDGTLCEWRHVHSDNELYTKGYFASLRPREEIVAAAKDLLKEGEEVYVVTCVLKDSPYALDEKKIWIRHYLPALKEDHCLFVPYGEDKAAFVAKTLGKKISCRDILVDDYSKNLFEWQAAGGKSVKVMNERNGTHGTWLGLRVTNDDAGTVLKELSEKTA